MSELGRSGSTDSFKKYTECPAAIGGIRDVGWPLCARLAVSPWKQGSRTLAKDSAKILLMSYKLLSMLL